MAQEIGQLLQMVHEQEDRFTKLDQANGGLLDFRRECLFARQQIVKNDYTAKIAAQAPNSLQSAILNVAAIGISLNPANAHAYLVPRDGAICLDISYRGLVKLATDSGAIKWAKVELVYENDQFAWRGPVTPPEHEADPFSDRGTLKGGYCLAKMPDGEFMVEVMPIDEINKIRDTSKAFQRNSGPWVDWPHEMAKKTVLKRAYKSWPQTPNRQRMDQAVHVLHQTEGTAYTLEQRDEFMGYVQSEDALGLFAMSRRTPQTVWTALFNSFEKGQKTAGKQKVRDLEYKGQSLLGDYVQELADRVNEEDAPGAQELLAELTEEQRELALEHMREDQKEFIRNSQKEAA